MTFCQRAPIWPARRAWLAPDAGLDPDEKPLGSGPMTHYPLTRNRLPDTSLGRGYDPTGRAQRVEALPGSSARGQDIIRLRFITAARAGRNRPTTTAKRPVGAGGSRVAL